MNLIALIGEPASGKTSVMRSVLARLGECKAFKFNLLTGRKYPRNLYVLGVYNGDKFDGTDRLSMAVQPHAIRFLSKVEKDATVLFEGDRLTRTGFFEEATRLGSVKLFVLKTSEAEKERRHCDRHDTQPEQFKRSRATVIRRITESLPCEALTNEKPADIEACAGTLVAYIENSIGPQKRKKTQREPTRAV